MSDFKKFFWGCIVVMIIILIGNEETIVIIFPAFLILLGVNAYRNYNSTYRQTRKCY